MTKKEFKYSMQRGLGRCIIELKNTENKEKYRNIVMWGCKHNLAYDTQCEGNRSLYLYDLICQFSDITPFLQTVEDRMNKCFHASGWEFDRNCELLSFFVMDGNNYASKILAHYYDKLLHVLLKKRKWPKQGIFPERDNFEFLCISLVTHNEDLSLCEEKYLKIVEDIGKLIHHNPLYSEWNFDWFQAACEDKIGKKRMNKLLRERRDFSTNAFVYWKAMNDASENHMKQRMKREQNFPKTADEVYKLLQKERRVRSILSISLVKKMLRNNNHQEVAKLAKYYESEKDESIRAQLLRLFARKECAHMVKLEQVIADSASDNEELSNYAFQVLGYIKHDMVHNFALSLVTDEKHLSDVISMLAQNYQKKDHDILINLVHKLPISYNTGEWHGAFSDILDMFHDKSIQKPPKELLYYMYENTLCSCCREYMVKEMGRRRMLTDVILEECLYDSNDEIRAYADILTYTDNL